MSGQYQELIALARHYCQLIDASGAGHAAWLDEIARILPILQRSLLSFRETRLGRGEHLLPDLDARFELFSHLRALLGDRDGYWHEFDRFGDAALMTGSLADDLTDIYCELKHGLRMAGEFPQQAIASWQDGFEHHWGQHLRDAQRHLSVLAAENRLSRSMPQSVCH